MGKLEARDRAMVGALLVVLAATAPSACGDDTQTPAVFAGSAGSDAAAGSGGSAAKGGASSSGGTSPATGGTSSGGSGADSTAPDSTRSACRAYLMAACERQDECGIQWPIANCLSLLDQCPDYLFSEGSTRTVEGTLACAQQWATQPCDQVLKSIPLDCATAGTLRAGEPCYFGSQCESLLCSIPYDKNCGSCLRFPNAGEQCDDKLIGCPPGQRCGSGTCTAYDPLVVPRVGAGESCFEDFQCPDGYVCVYESTAGGLRTCRALPVAGQPCGWTTSWVYCAPTAYCDAQQVCQTSPGAGQPCATDANGNSACAPGAHCANSSTGVSTCVADYQAGETCSASQGYLFRANCAGELVCACVDGACSAGKCASLRDEGESCAEANTVCALGTECQSGRCVAVDSLGLFEKMCGG